MALLLMTPTYQLNPTSKCHIPVSLTHSPPPPPPPPYYMASNLQCICKTYSYNWDVDLDQRTTGNFLKPWEALLLLGGGDMSFRIVRTFRASIRRPSYDSNNAMQERDTPQDIDGVDATAGAGTRTRTEDLAD
jgi:hypothetical protein